MERDRFYTEFEEAFDDDKAIEAVRQYFENNKKQKVMNENEVFRLKGRIAISNLSREDKDMINSILDDINKRMKMKRVCLYRESKTKQWKGCTYYFIFQRQERSHI